MSELIPKLLNSLKLDTKIKNKVREVLDKQGYFKDTVIITKQVFKDCLDISFLPQYFKDKDHEPLTSVSNAKRAWNEKIKSRLLQFARDG